MVATDAGRVVANAARACADRARSHFASRCSSFLKAFASAASSLANCLRAASSAALLAARFRFLAGSRLPVASVLLRLSGLFPAATGPLLLFLLGFAAAARSGLLGRFASPSGLRPWIWLPRPLPAAWLPASAASSPPTADVSSASAFDSEPLCAPLAPPLAPPLEPPPQPASKTTSASTSRPRSNVRGTTRRSLTPPIGC